MNKKPVDLESVPELIVLFSDISEEAKEIATQAAKLAWLNKSKSDRTASAWERACRRGAASQREGVGWVEALGSMLTLVISFAYSPFSLLPSALRSDYLYWQQCAELIKTELEKALGPTWHVIVGDHFGAFVAHEVGKCFYFSIGQMVSTASTSSSSSGRRQCGVQ